MSNTDIEIVVDDPTAPEPDSPAVTSTGVVDVVVSLLLLAVAVTLGWDNWRTGAAWDSTGPQPGYFPFSLSVILGGASFYGLATAFLSRKEAAEVFVTRAQLRRVMAVFVPTFLFCLVTRFSKDPDSFGKGRIEGVFAPETAAHASGTAALLPMLALGIPGSGTAAIFAGRPDGVGPQPRGHCCSSNTRISSGA